MALFATELPCAMSLTRILTRSQLLNLLSMAKLKRAKSRIRLAICKRIRIDQTSLSLRGGFCPTSLSLFQGMPCLGESVVRRMMVPPVVYWNQIMTIVRLAAYLPSIAAIRLLHCTIPQLALSRPSFGRWKRVVALQYQGLKATQPV